MVVNNADQLSGGVLAAIIAGVGVIGISICLITIIVIIFITKVIIKHNKSRNITQNGFTKKTPFDEIGIQ